MRTQTSVPQLSPCMRRWPGDPQENQDDNSWLGLKLGLRSQEHRLLLWKLSHLTICFSFVPTNFCLLICLQMILLLNFPMNFCLIWNPQSQFIQIWLTPFKRSKPGQNKLSWKHDCMACQRNDREEYFLAKGGGLSNMDGNRPSRLCLLPSQAPGAPSHGQALQIQASCTHHTVWCWHWCSQAYLWPHRYSSHNLSLRHWRKSKWIYGLCSQSSLHPGQWLTCSRTKHCWSGPTIKGSSRY